MTEGKAVEVVKCAGCGRENPAANRFCTYCGAAMAPSPGGGLEGLWQDEYRRLVRTINQLADRVGEGFHRVRKELEKAENELEKTRQESENELEKTRQTVLTTLGNAESAFSGFSRSLSEGMMGRASEYAKELERRLDELDRIYSTLILHCPACQRALGPGMRYCTECGREGVAPSAVNPLKPLVGRILSHKKERDQAKEEVDKLKGKLKDMVDEGGVIYVLFIVGLFTIFYLFVMKEKLPEICGTFWLVVGSVVVLYVIILILGESRFRKAEDALNQSVKDLGRALEERSQAIRQSIEAQTEAIRQHIEAQTEQKREAARQEAGRRIQEISQKAASELREWMPRRNEFLRRIAPWIVEWSSDWSSWKPVENPFPALRIGRLSYKDDIFQRIGFQEPIQLPALIPFRRGKGLLIHAGGSARVQAIQAIQSLGFRLLSAVPPGKLRFTFIDPVGLGQNVSGLIQLKDYDEASSEDSLVTFRAWTEADHIRQQLVAIKEHITTIIQERLRDQYPDIETYNQKEGGGGVTVPYRILMVLDFPANFNDEAAQHLLSIVQTGPRVGVFPIVLLDPSRKLPYDFKVEELARSMETIRWDEKSRCWVWEDPDFGRWRLDFDQPPPSQVAEVIVKEWGSRAQEGMRVEVPFEKMLEMAELHPSVWWQDSTRECLKVPLGPITARKPQYLELGKGTLNHALIVGRTGSGKSNLLHVLITAASLKYDPDELRLYLIDLKTVEFVVYRDLPHAEAVAVDADREFALSVIEGLDREMAQRMEAFKSVKANDLAEYRDKTGKKLPRILLIVDEFQVLFERDDRVAQESARLLDRLVRQGRAFGIHVLLGSQSLAGHALPRSTIDQMAVRIALQCSEADSRLVLAEDNPAARRLARPGQAIYNSQNGLIEGNTEFQVALFSDQDREVYIQRIREKAQKDKITRKPIVFEGNEPARIEECVPLIRRLEGGPTPSLRYVETWLGEPVSIRPPVAVRWARRSGSHLVVVTREEEEGVGILMATVLGLCLQYPVDRLWVGIADFSTAESPWAELSDVFQMHSPHGRQGRLRVLGRRELLGVLNEWEDILNRALQEDKRPLEDRYLFLVGLHRIRDLRLQDDVGYTLGGGETKPPSAQLADILREGPELGMHVVLWCDTVANLHRHLERRALNEIGWRVAGPMSEQDSMSLLDSAEASRLDKPHRMVFYDDERPGVLEKFRPYVIRDKHWLIQVLERIARGGPVYAVS